MNKRKSDKTDSAGFSDSYIPDDHEDDTPLYQLNDTDSSGDEEDAYENPDAIYDMEAPDEEDEEDIKLSKLSPFAALLKTMLTPVEGWKALKRAHFKTENFASGCFYPIVAFTAVSAAVKIFYEADYSMISWLLDGMSIFLSFFFGYFTILVLATIVLPKKSRDLFKTEVGKQFVMLNLSTLAIFWSLINLIPMLDPVLVFLPIWTIYLIFRGLRVLRVDPDVATSTTGLTCLLILGIPLLWNWILTELLLPAAYPA